MNEKLRSCWIKRLDYEHVLRRPATVCFLPFTNLGNRLTSLGNVELQIEIPLCTTTTVTRSGILLQFKARLDQVVLSSHGCKLLGGFYGAAGETPRPTAILLHGVPGVEKNLDFAYALRDAGWNTLYFHYRGCWGSEGTYSFDGLLDDVRAATEWTLRQPSVDREFLVLMGSSMGGYATLAAGAADARFKALVALCPLIEPVTVPLPVEMATEFATMLQGVTAEQLRREWEHLPPIVNMVSSLRSRKILLVTGDQDDLFRPSHYEFFVSKLPNVRWQRFPIGDHSFCTCRKELVQTVLEWLTGLKN